MGRGPKEVFRANVEAFQQQSGYLELVGVHAVPAIVVSVDAKASSTILDGMSATMLAEGQAVRRMWSPAATPVACRTAAGRRICPSGLIAWRVFSGGAHRIATICPTVE